MKKTFLLLLFAIIPLVSFAQSDSLHLTIKETVPNQNKIEEEKTIMVDGEVFTKTTDRYKIYSTTNMYNLLKLDTQTGQIWRIQWNLDDEKRFESVVSYKCLVESDDIWVNGRFEIYPTQNIYNFILSPTHALPA